MGRTMEWDGERIRETREAEEKKHTPKELIESLDSIRGQIGQMKHAEEQFRKQTEQNDVQIKDAETFEAELAPFEEKALEIQREKVLLVINQNHKELVEKARKEADAEIARDPSAYDERQREILPYLKYQKSLAIHPKMVEKVAPRVIRDCLFNDPVFENPFLAVGTDVAPEPEPAPDETPAPVIEPEPEPAPKSKSRPETQT